MTTTKYIVYCKDFRTNQWEEQEDFNSESEAKTYCEDGLNPDVAYKITRKTIEEVDL